MVTQPAPTYSLPKANEAAYRCKFTFCFVLFRSIPPITVHAMKKTIALGIAALLGITLVFTMLRSQAVAEVPPASESELSLITATPEDGFALALRLSRLGVTETQPDREVLHSLRPDYAHNSEALIAASHVAAVHFQTIAAANNYWR